MCCSQTIAGNLASTAEAIHGILISYAVSVAGTRELLADVASMEFLRDV